MVFGVKRRQALSPTSCYEPCTRKSRMLGGRDAERSIRRYGEHRPGDRRVVNNITERSPTEPSLRTWQTSSKNIVLYSVSMHASASCRGSSCFLVNFVVRSVHSFDGVAKSSSIYQNETLKENFIITFYLSINWSSSTLIRLYLWGEIFSNGI
jgi:hypothetical protein